MSDNGNIILLGYSGHAFVVADAAAESGVEVKYYADRKVAKLNPFNLEYLGTENHIDFLGWGKGFRFILGIGDNHIRERIALGIIAKGETLMSIIHPTSSISSKTKLGSGIFISKNVSVNTLAVLGDYSILNTGCIIEHECLIGKAVHIAPGAVLAGNVVVGDRTFIGANSVIKQGVMIGKDVIIGAGSVVIRNVPDNSKIAGNPGKGIK